MVNSGNENRNDNRGIRVCEHCQKEYVARHFKQRFCSTDCRLPVKFSSIYSAQKTDLKLLPRFSFNDYRGDQNTSLTQEVIMERKDLCQIQDELEDVTALVAFLQQITVDLEDSTVMTEQSRTGVYLFVTDILDRLNKIRSDLSLKKQN